MITVDDLAELFYSGNDPQFESDEDYVENVDKVSTAIENINKDISESVYKNLSKLNDEQLEILFGNNKDDDIQSELENALDEFRG